MKNLLSLKSFIIVVLTTVSAFSYAQLADGFDIKKAYHDAKVKGVNEKTIDEYVNKQHGIYLRAKKSLDSHNHKNHSNNAPVDLGTIYKNYNGNNINYRPASPNSPQNVYCPNAGFEQGTFLNWSGATGDVTTGPTGAAFPNFVQTGAAILNPDGNNVSVQNPNNFHTIMTTPATNSVYPNCVGYDSLAVRVVGTQSVSEIPYVNPTGGPASVRLNGFYFSNDVGSKLTYNLGLNPNNKNFSVSYALVLNSGGNSHTSAEQPYFSVRVLDQNGNLVPGCSQYTITINDDVITPGSPSYDPTWNQSIHTNTGSNIYYRKWQTYAFDFSNYPAITSVNIEFYVGGCSLSGHFGYAYVDASCSQGGAVASFCAGSNTSVLTAPAGYTTYQWTGPGGPVSVGNGGNTGTATITPVTAGQVFTCNVTAPNGCSSVFTTTISITTVSVTGISSTPSCLNGNSGTAIVAATGSSSGYTYQWFNSSGATVGSAQTATGLSPGIYSVTVSSPLCGSATSTVQVDVSAPTFYSLTAPYCGTTAWITNNGGSNYKWYTASPLALIPGATSSSLTINSPVNNAAYFLVYTTASGCKDSIRYVLNQQPGGNIYVSNIKSICAGNNNSYAIVNLQTTAPPVYSYTVTGPAGYNSVLNNTNSLKDSVINLSLGTYSATVFDGQCLYNTTFSVSPLVYSYTLTPATSTICSAGSTSLAVNFGNTTPTSCGLSTSGGCTSPNNIQVGSATTQGNSGVYTPYGSLYESARNQYLFRASELIAAGVAPGKIDKLAFNVTNINGNAASFAFFTIKLKCVAYTVLPTASMDNNGLATVYGPQNINASVGWNTYNFTQAYEWDGVSNLLVDVCFFNQDWDGNIYVEYTNVGYTASKYVNADGSDQCPITTVDGTDVNRPNVRFGNCAGNPGPSAYNYTWTPTIGLSSSTTYTTIANPTVTTVYTVQVSPIGQTNCAQTQTSTVTVISQATPTISPVATLCSNANSFTLTALPTGGTWSLTAPTSTAGVFTPSLAATGNNTVTYIYGGAGCLQTTTAIVPIERYVPSTITGAINPICLPGSNVNLSTALTTSTLGVGVWSGNGVSGTTFNPITAGIGTHTLTYSTNSIPTTALCPSQSTIAVTVNSAAQPTITAVAPLCTNASSVALSVTPTGGTWFGTGVSSTGAFTPSLALVGNNTYTYTVGASTCSATNTLAISVEQFVPSTITGAINTLCITNPIINLSTALTTSTLGVGVWSGNGVSGTSFDPNVAGVGTHTLTYSTNSVPTTALCPSQSTIAITVNSVVQPTITAAGPFCDSFTAQQLVANPTGGVWSAGTVGTSITNTGLLSSNSSLVGTNKILYTLTNAPCVKKDSINVTIVHFIPATITGALGPYCIYDAAVALQPSAQFTGGVWSGNGVTGSSFSPTAAGANIHTITYSTDPAPAGLCPDSKNLTITVNPKPNANAVPNTTVGCNPVTVNYATTTVNTGIAVWDFGDGSPRDTGLIFTHVYTTPGTYTATLYYTDNNGCKDTTTAVNDITVNALPIASFEPSVIQTTVIDGQVEFINQSTVLGNNTYAWDIGDAMYTSTNIDESYLFTTSGNYVVTLFATSAEGCVDDTSIVIIVNPDVVLYVPNAFTPGADGLNDVFQIFLPPSGVDYSTFNLKVFDRWGELIYQTNDVTLSWTGAKNNSGPILKQDVYVYKITFQDEKKKHYEKIGHVSLLRK